MEQPVAAIGAIESSVSSKELVPLCLVISLHLQQFYERKEVNSPSART